MTSLTVVSLRCRLLLQLLPIHQLLQLLLRLLRTTLLSLLRPKLRELAVSHSHHRAFLLRRAQETRRRELIQWRSGILLVVRMLRTLIVICLEDLTASEFASERG